MPRKFKGRPFWRANPIVIDLDKVRFIDTKFRYCGKYDEAKIKNGAFKFPDHTHGKTCYIRFQGGDMWLEERLD